MYLVCEHDMLEVCMSMYRSSLSLLCGPWGTDLSLQIGWQDLYSLSQETNTKGSWFGHCYSLLSTCLTAL